MEEVVGEDPGEAQPEADARVSIVLQRGKKKIGLGFLQLDRVRKYGQLA